MASVRQAVLLALVLPALLVAFLVQPAIAGRKSKDVANDNKSSARAKAKDKAPIAPKEKSPAGAARIRILGSKGSPNQGILTIAPYASSKGDPKDFGYICDDGAFTDQEAALFCAVEGFKHGRLYRLPGGNFDDKLPPKAPEASFLSLWVFEGCYSSKAGNTSDTSSDTGGSSSDSNSTSGGAGKKRKQGKGAPSRRLLLHGDGLPTASHGRQLRFMASAELDLGRRGSCSFRTQHPVVNTAVNQPECAGKPYVGIECSDKKLPPLPSAEPSPPPAPSTAPPRPPSRAAEVRVIFDRSLESNLCEGDLCDQYMIARVEAPAGNDKWAPVCWPESGAEEWQHSNLANIICRQFMDWPWSGDNIIVSGRMADMPFPLPSTSPEAGSGGFDPASYGSWAHLPAELPASLGSAVQDVGLQVSAAKCASGLLRVQCNVLVS